MRWLHFASFQITTDFSVEQNCSECFALRPFTMGEQIYIYYGSRSNAELLLHNGFLYKGNKNDKIHLRLGRLMDKECGPVMQSFGIFNSISLQLLNKHLNRGWFEMPWSSCDFTVMFSSRLANSPSDFYAVLLIFYILGSMVSHYHVIVGLSQSAPAVGWGSPLHAWLASVNW